MKHFVYRITILNNIDERKYYVGKHSGSLDDFENKNILLALKLFVHYLKIQKQSLK